MARIRQSLAIFLRQLRRQITHYYAVHLHANGLGPVQHQNSLHDLALSADGRIPVDLLQCRTISGYTERRELVSSVPVEPDRALVVR